MKTVQIEVSNLNIENCINFLEYNNVDKIEVRERVYSPKIQKIDISLLKDEDDILNHDLYEFTENIRYLSLVDFIVYANDINYKKNEEEKLKLYKEIRRFPMNSKERMKLHLLLMTVNEIKFQFMIKDEVVGKFSYKDFSCELNIKKEFSKMIKLLLTDTATIEECHLKAEKEMTEKDIEAFQKLAKRNDDFICLYCYEGDPLQKGLEFKLINNNEVILEENEASKSYYMKGNSFKLPKNLQAYSKHGIVLKENNYLISDFKFILV